MQLILIILFAVLGLMFAKVGDGLLGFSAGALIGYLLARVRNLQAQVTDIAAQLARFAKKEGTPDRFAVADRKPVSLYEPEPAAKPVGETQGKSAGEALGEPASKAAPTAATIPAAAQKPLASPKPAHKWQAPADSPITPREPGPVDKLFERAKEWITTGNVPVKVGVIVSFFGVSFLLKYAVDRQFIVISIEMRYLLVAIGAGILLTIGWRLRDKMRTYALSLQGGGIGILFLTIFAAFRLHPLLPAPFAFALLVLLTASTGVLAVLQNARWLAILGTVGGFLAPVLVSTGSGNHVALFSYYLLLNSAILGIAWHKTWRDLNIIGFVFTFGVGTMWGAEYYRPELFVSTEPFLVAFFLFYQVIAVLFAFHQQPKLRSIVDGTLIFGTPVIAFALQAELVEHTEYGLAISAIVLAVFYTLVGAWLHRNRARELRLLIESFIALAVAFATIAIPLALDDRWTAVAWALEGAALIWVGVRQHGFLARVTGIALLGASGIAYLNYGWIDDVGLPLLNGNFLGGILISVASLFAAHRLEKDDQPIPLQSLVSIVLFAWGLVWWASVGSAEIFDRVQGRNEAHVLVAFAAASGVSLAWLARRLEWPIARIATLAYLPALGFLALFYAADFGHILVGIGTWSWIAAIVVHFVVLRIYDDGRGKLEAGWHLAGALLIATTLEWETVWRMDHAEYSVVWTTSTAMLITIAMTLLITFGRGRLAWPLQRYWSAYFIAACILTILQLLTLGVAGIDNAGDPAPLPYVPVLNPFDMLTIIGLVVALHVAQTGRATTDWFARDKFNGVMVALGIAAFLLSTIGVVRGVHSVGDISWQPNALTRSVAVQSALSIYWAILGLGGMIWGARHARRWVWMVGTGLMALVVAKLFLIDLGNTGTVARIVSFLGVGAMLLVVGYFAPAPPRHKAAPEQTEDRIAP